MPDAVGELIEATTDKDGLAVIDAAANEEVAYVDVHSQGVRHPGAPVLPVDTEAEARLAPAGRVAQGPARGRRSARWSRAGGSRPTRGSGDRSSRDPATTGYAIGDDRRRGPVLVPRDRPGRPPARAQAARGTCPSWPTSRQSLAVIEGRENSLEIPLRKAATITGVVRERGTGRPVPGVELYFGPLRGGKTPDRPRPTPRGDTRSPACPARCRIIVFGTPPTHVLGAGPALEGFHGARGAGRIELEPIGGDPRRAAAPVRGARRDGQARPRTRRSPGSPSSR